MENAVENACGALDKFLFFFSFSFARVAPRRIPAGIRFFFFFFLLFLFREALSPRARSISPTEFRHVNGRKKGASTLNREKHEVLNVFRAIVSRSHGDNSDRSAAFRYERIARVEAKKRVDDLRVYASPGLNVNERTFLLLPF